MPVEFTALTRGDRALAKVIIERDGMILAKIEVDAKELDEAIAELGKARAALRDRIPETLVAGDRLNVIADYRWHVGGVKSFGKRIVAWRHPGYGWLAFGMADDEAKALAKALTANLPDPSAKAGGRA